MGATSRRPSTVEVLEASLRSMRFCGCDGCLATSAVVEQHLSEIQASIRQTPLVRPIAPVPVPVPVK